MLRTKSLRITAGLEERKDDVPPLPTWEPPRTAPPRTSLALGANGPPSSTASEFGFAQQAYLSAPITPSPRSTSPGRGRSWTKTLNFFKSARRKQNPTSTPNTDDIPFEGISGSGPGLVRWSIEEKVGHGYPLGHSAGSTLSLPATAVPNVESAARSRKTSMPQLTSPHPPPQRQQISSPARGRASTVARETEAQTRGPALTTPTEIRRKRSTTDIRDAGLPSKHVRIVKPDSAWRRDVPHRGMEGETFRPRQHQRTPSTSSNITSYEIVPPKAPPVPARSERRKRSSIMNSFSSSKSLTPLQLLRSTGFLSAGMIRDEAPPMEILLSSSSSASDPSGGQTEYSEGSPTTSSPDPGGSEESGGITAAVRDSLLNQEAAPFDMATTDSIWFEPPEKKPANNDGPPRTRQAPRRKPPPLPILKDIAFLESRPVLCLPGTPDGNPRSCLTDMELEDDVEMESIGSVLEELSGLWPLPPRRSLIIVGHRGELWTSPNSEAWTSVEPSFPPRDSICFSSKGFSSSSVKARIRNLSFSDEQLTAIRAHLRSAPPVSTRTSRTPVLVRGRADSSVPSSPTDSVAYGTPSSEATVKMTETRIDVDDEQDGGVEGTMHAVLHLSSTYSPGQMNRITIISSSWKKFTSFCQNNGRTIISAVMGDASRSLSVTVQDDDGSGKVYCTMMLKGAQFPVPSSPNGLTRVVTKFNVHLPVSLAEIGRRCMESSVGEGVMEVQEERSVARSSVGTMTRSRSRRNALVLTGFPRSR